MILVRGVLEDARRRLAVIRREASVCDAADILANASKPLVIVCNDEDVAVGVITRTDIVKVFSRARALLDEVTNEEGLLRDYVLGIGYQ